MEALESTFIELLNFYTEDQVLIQSLWQEVASGYSAPGRYYHTLFHLKLMLQELVGVKTKLNNWESVLFALYYHDLVYDPMARDNEEKSAVLAEQRMKQVGVPATTRVRCRELILATQGHRDISEPDTRYFLDADLAILGQHPAIYEEYANRVREEYKAYPDDVYNAGRRRVLLHFLEMRTLYKTGYFYNRFESQARENMEAELSRLKLGVRS